MTIQTTRRRYRTEYEEVREDTVQGVEENRDQEINEIDAEGHLEKTLKGSWVTQPGSKFRVQRMILLRKRFKKVKLSLEIYTNYVEQIKINTHP